MAFNPDKWLEDNSVASTTPEPVAAPRPSFNPDAWLAENAQPQAQNTPSPASVPASKSTFDPDAWLEQNATPEPTKPPYPSLDQFINRNGVPGYIKPQTPQQSPVPTPGMASFPASTPPGVAPTGKQVSSVTPGAEPSLGQKAFRAVEKAATKDTYVGQQALSTGTQALDFFPSMLRGARSNVRNVLVSAFGEKAADIIGNVAQFTPGAAVVGRGKGGEELDRWLDASGNLRAEAKRQLEDAAWKQGGMTGSVVSGLVEGVQQTLMNLKTFKALNIGYGDKVKGATKWAKSGMAVKNAMIRAGLMTATTRQPTAEDAVKSFALSAAYQSTPAVSGWMNSSMATIAADIGLNFALSTSQVNGIIESSRQAARAEGDPDKSGLYIALALTQMFGSDVVFGAMTKSFNNAAAPPPWVRRAITSAQQRGDDATRKLVRGDAAEVRAAGEARVQGNQQTERFRARYPGWTPEGGPPPEPPAGFGERPAGERPAPLRSLAELDAEQLAARGVLRQEGQPPPPDVPPSDAPTAPRTPMQAAVSEAEAVIDRLDTFRSTGRLSASDPQLRRELGKVAKRNGVTLNALLRETMWQAEKPAAEERTDIPGENVPRHTVKRDVGGTVYIVDPDGNIARGETFTGRKAMEQATARAAELDASAPRATTTPTAARDDAKTPEPPVKRGAGPSIEDAYRSGMDVKTIAKTFGVDYTAVTERLEKAGLISVSRPAPESTVDLSAMKLPELKAQARAEGVEPTGSAAAIRERISGKRRLTEAPAAQPTAQAPAARTGFVPAAQRGAQPAETVTPVQKLPAEDLIPTQPRRLRIWLREHFLPSRGVGSELYDKYVDMHAAVAAGQIESKQNVRRVNRLIDVATKTSGRTNDDIRQEMIDVVNGRLAIDEFVARNGLSEATDEIKLIRQMQSEKESRQQLLAESVNGSAALKRRISEFDYYQTRMYERFLLGDKYTPDPEDYRAGVGMVADEIAGKLSQIERLGQKLAVKGAPFGRGEPTVAVDVADWLRTGDTALLEGLATSRQTRLIALRNTYQRYADLVDSVAQGKDGGLVLAQDAVKVADAAKDAIDYYLSKNDQAIQGANGIANLRRRVLDDVWRKLYGEITDPAYTSGRSTEVQTQLLAQQAFFRDAHDEGRDKYWWERSAPGRVQLGKRDKYFDRLRYGPLAGKFVTQETHDLLHPSPRSNSIARNIADAAFFKPQATMRLLKLIAPKTITRNYVTAYTGFAMASGDVALPGFHKHFAEAHKLIARAARGEEAATETMRQLAAVNAFRTSTSSIIQDIDRAVSKSPGGRMSAALQKVGNAYAYIDFPTKYAAYMARMESGMTPQQAAKHVQDMYQNRDRIPKIIGQIGQGGLADYFGYTYDSVRITANQIQHARAEAKRGNLAPAIGFLVGHGLQAALISAKATAAVGGVWAAIHRLLREEYFVEESKQLEPVVMAALRDFQPEYYENAAQVSWEERKGGERTVYYTILSGHTAWPVEDFVIGVGQRARQEGVGSIPRAAIGQVAERVGPGMYVDVLAKAMMGESFGSKYNSKGVWDSFQIPHDSDRGRIVLEAAGKYLADVYGGSVGQWASETYDYTSPRSSAYRERTRESGTYVNSITPKEIAVGKAALVRTYRITKSDMERLIKARVKDWSLAVISAKQSRNEPARLRSIESLTGIVNNARKVSGDWFSEREYVAILRDAGLNKDEAEAAVEGNVSSLEQYNPERTPTNLERVRNPKQSTGMSLDAGMDLSL